MDKLKVISQRLHSDDRQTLITALQELRANELAKILQIVSEKEDVIKTPYGKYRANAKDSIENYLVDIDKKWHELLTKVPTEEQAQHEEYGKINQKLEYLLLEDENRGTFPQVMKIIFRTFGYDDSWQILLKNTPIHSTN